MTNNNHLNDIVNISNQLVRAVECLQNPNAAPYERNEAYTICEQFKDSSPVCIPCAIYLLEHDSHLVRHFGLQLMEHCVKYKWYQVELEEKLAIREKSMELLDRRCVAVAGYTHLKDGLARVMVEMIKREWPQQWPELFPNLFEIAYRGNCVQAELVLLILLRLVEDVAVLHTLQSPQRRKDLYHSLSLQLENIFGFLLNLMQKYYQQALMNGENDAVRVVRLNLMVLYEFIEWAPLHRILADNGKIVHVLAVVIMNGDFCVEAVDCFLQILRRRGGKQEELYSVAQTLFSTNLIDQFYESSDRRNAILLLNGCCGEFGEREYDFAKKMSALLLSIANFLNLLTEKYDGSFELFLQKNALMRHKLEMYFKILLDLCGHSSYVVLCNVVAAWRIVFRNSSLNEMPAVLEHIPNYINSIVPKIVRVPYGVNSAAGTAAVATAGNESAARTWLSEAKKFILLDFETEDSYVKCIYRFRNELVPTLRSACELAPQIVYLYVEEMMTSCIAAVASSSSSSPLCDPDYYLRWEPLTVTMDAVFAHFRATRSPPWEDGLPLIDLCLNVHSRDPVILTNLLTCLSNLMVFIQDAAQDNASQDTVAVYLPKIIDFVVACLVFRPPIAEASNDFNANGVSHNGSVSDSYRILKDLHTAAGGFMVRTSVHYPGLLLPFFEYIYVIYNRLKHETRQLSKSEDVLLLEALVSISNDFRDFERQSTFIATIVESNVESHWKETRLFLQSEPEFARFIGLDVDQQPESCFENRLKLMYTIELLSAIVLRCGSTKERARCGFVRDCGDKNPATARLIPLLPDIFMLVRVLNGLWSSDGAARAKVTHPIYANVFDITDTECRMLNEAVNVCPSSGSAEKEDDCDFGRQKNFPTRMQNFLCDLYQKCFLLLSRSSERFGNAFYNMPNFPGSFIASVLYNVDRMPDYRVRVPLKHFMKPLVWHCPPSHYDQILIPILEHFTVHMSERLNNRWNYLNECRLDENNVVDDPDKCGAGGDNISTNNKEMIERLLITQLSREYMDLVKTILFSTYADSSTDKVNATNTSGSLSNLHATGSALDNVSELGEKALNNSIIAPALLSFLLPAISWDDSLNSSKAVTMMPMIVKQLIASYPLNVTPELAAKILIHLLQGIQVHGEHDSNIGSLLYTTIAVYEMLRPNSANLPEILAMVPGINLDELRKFDENVLKNGIKEKINKGKREHFKKLVGALVGQNVGQLFKRKEHFRDLPRMLNRTTKNNNSSTDVLNSFCDPEIIGISNLFR